MHAIGFIARWGLQPLANTFAAPSDNIRGYLFWLRESTSLNLAPDSCSRKRYDIKFEQVF